MVERGNERRQALERLLEEVSRTCDTPALRQLRPAVLEAQGRLNKGEVYLAVLGQMKRGKTSLLNALLGENLLPTGILPLTSVVTEIRYGQTPVATVLYHSGISWEIALDEIPLYVTEKANPGNRKGVSRLILQHPSELLENGVVLVDTPGIGSTYSHNTATTNDFLKNVDAAIVVFSIDPPITASEAEFVHDLRDTIPKLIFVLNKTDLATEEEVADALAFLQDELVNRIKVGPCAIFPLSTKRSGGDIDPGLHRFADYLSRFSRYGQDDSLFLSILKDIQHTLALASFSLTLGRSLSSLSPTELEQRRLEIEKVLGEADTATDSLKVLLQRKREDLITKMGVDLDERVKTALPLLQEQFAGFRSSHNVESGQRLGQLLEDFFNREIAALFRDWRMQEDVLLSRSFDGTVAEYTAKANAILCALVRELDRLMGLQVDPLKVHCALAMDAKVSYSVEPVFYSLDRGLLFLPPFLQRPIVFRRVAKSVPSRLDRNAGRIRFDYRERIERSFVNLERSLFVQVQSARDSLTQVLQAPVANSALLGEVTALQSYVKGLQRDEPAHMDDSQARPARSIRC